MPLPRLADLLRIALGKPIQRIPVRVGAGEPRHPLAIATAIRNEAPYLGEWPDFHAAQGVTHVFIYDNGSTDGMQDVLAPYVRSGFVTVRPWVHRWGWHTRARAYAHAPTTHGASTRWLAIIDVDEFLYCPGGETLVQFLEGVPHIEALIVHRHTYGASGHLTPPGSVTRSFHPRVPAPDGPFEMKNHFAPKSTVQPQGVAAVNGAHTFVLKGTEVRGHDEAEEAITGRRAPAFRADRIRIDHYYTKDRQTFLARMARARTVTNTTVTAEEWLGCLDQVESRAIVPDNGILSVCPGASSVLQLVAWQPARRDGA